MRLLHLAFIAVVVAGCASKPYRETQEGKFSGALDVRWVHNDYFLFLPNKDEALGITIPESIVLRADEVIR